MIIIYKALVFSLLIFPVLASARESGKNNIFFFQGLVGSTILGESENVPVGAGEEQVKKAALGLTTALGYKWETFSFELIYANFGKTSNNMDDFYLEEHEASFIGGGLHWTWSWFDLKLGWGGATDTTTYVQGDRSTTFRAFPDKSKTSSAGGYFGLGFNFDLSPTTEFIIDYTGYAWTNDEPQRLGVDANPDLIFTENKVGMAVLSLGLRFFF
ncbi:MAG TPA: hypothetical protein VNJ08_15045 [Bacteriovoracaceae bacterium]|nr:hypothetical protein [Bacteriovoracaceae bacterium]